jgi:hypothetical protein
VSNVVVTLAAVGTQVARVVVGLAAVGAVVVAVVGAVADHGQQRPPPHTAS